MKVFFVFIKDTPAVRVEADSVEQFDSYTIKIGSAKIVFQKPIEKIVEE